MFSEVLFCADQNPKIVILQLEKTSVLRVEIIVDF